MDAETGAQILALERMSTATLRQRYAETFGEATLVQNKAWLIKRIAWRLQAKAEGDLSERARKRASELADDADLRLSPPRPKRDEATTAETPTAVARPAAPAATLAPTPATIAAPAGHDPRLPPPGSVITRKYKGRQIQVLVLADGFRFDGKAYASLSAVAKAVTGQHQNGFLFFKLNAKGGEQ
jgi:hypothetical protein